MTDESSQSTAGCDTEAYLLIKFLSERNVECPICGYDLRSSTTTSCAECGSELALNISATNRSIWPWATTLALCLSSFPFAVLLIGTVFVHRWGRVKPWEYPVYGALVFLSILSIALVLMRKRFIRQPNFVQIMMMLLIIVVWVFPIVMTLVFA